MFYYFTRSGLPLPIAIVLSIGTKIQKFRQLLGYSEDLSQDCIHRQFDRVLSINVSSLK